MRIQLLQSVIPDYRLGFFKLLIQRYPVLYFVAGEEDFGTLKSVSMDTFCYTRVSNIFFAKKRFLWQAGALAYSSTVDLLICNHNPRILSTLIAVLVRGILRKPSIAWNHISMDSGPRGSFFWLYSMMFDGLVCYTQSQALVAKQKLKGKLVTFAPNACMSKADCFSVEISAESVTDFLFVGRLVSAKKPRLALDAFSIAINHLPANVRLVFIGHGPERDTLEACVASSPILQGRVVFLGHVGDVGQLRQHYAKAVSALSPGYVGLSATQAFSFGCPMLIAEGEPHSPEIEACIDGFNSYFFESSSSSALATSMIRVWDERSRWLANRENLCAWTRSRYSFEAMADNFGKAINIMLADQPLRVL